MKNIDRDSTSPLAEGDKKEELIQLILGSRLEHVDHEFEKIQEQIQNNQEKTKEQFIENLKYSSENSPKKMSKALSPVIGQAISNQVKNERGKIIDALYPVIGSMIAKYVKEALQNTVSQMNQKMDQTFSFGTAVRKVKSNLSGVSEAELLLLETDQTNVIGSYLVSQESGKVIVEAHKKKSLDLDSDLFGGALTAIKDFISDCSKNPNQINNLNLIKFGGLNILIESAGSYFLALIVEGDVSPGLRKKAQILLSESLSHIDFNQMEVSESSQSSIRDLLYEFAIQTTPGVEKESFLKKCLPYLGALVLFIVFLRLLGGVQVHNIESKIEKHPEFRMYNLDLDFKWFWGYELTGLLPNTYIKNDVFQFINKQTKLFPEMPADKVKVIKNITSPEYVLEKFQDKLDVFNKHYGASLEVNLSDQIYKVSGTLNSVQEEHHFIENLKTLPGTFIYEKKWKIKNTSKPNQG